MKIPLIVYLWLFLCLIFYAGGEYYSKIYSLHPNWKIFSLVIFLYAINSSLWLPAISSGKNLTVISTLWNLSYMMVAPIIGLILFKESISTLQFCGLGLGFISIILMNF